MASDTLTVEQVEGNNYQVFRRTGYNLKTENGLGPREHQTEHWSCLYSEDTKTLTELKKGTVLAFFPDRNELRVGKRMYKKMN